MVSVRGKTAIVTGGAAGIGYQCCVHLLANGVKCVAILDLPNSKGEESVSKLNEDFGGGRALFFPSDVTKHEEFEGICKKAVEAMQGLDILVNNAGIFNDSEWRKTIEINFVATVKSTLLGCQIMCPSKGGRGGVIVNVSSVLGLCCQEHSPVYTATKHAVLAFTVSMKEAFENAGVTGRIICPGATKTPLYSYGEHKFLEFVNHKEAIKMYNKSTIQTTASVGKALVEIIEKGTNCSVWVSQNSKPPFEVELAKYETVHGLD